MFNKLLSNVKPLHVNTQYKFFIKIVGLLYMMPFLDDTLDVVCNY